MERGHLERSAGLPVRNTHLHPSRPGSARGGRGDLGSWRGCDDGTRARGGGSEGAGAAVVGRLTGSEGPLVVGLGAPEEPRDPSVMGESALGG